MTANLKLLSGKQIGTGVNFDAERYWIAQQPDGTIKFSSSESATAVKAGHLALTSGNWFFEPVKGFPWFVDGNAFDSRKRVRIKSGTVIRLSISGPDIRFEIGESQFPAVQDSTPRVVASEPTNRSVVSPASISASTPVVEVNQISAVKTKSLSSNLARTGFRAWRPIVGTLLVGVLLVIFFAWPKSERAKVADVAPNPIADSNAVVPYSNQLSREIVWLGIQDGELTIPGCTGVVIGEHTVAFPARVLEQIDLIDQNRFRVFSEGIEGGSTKILSIVFPPGFVKNSNVVQPKNFGHVEVEHKFEKWLHQSKADNYLGNIRRYQFKVCGYRFIDNKISQESISRFNLPEITIEPVEISAVHPLIDGLPVVELMGNLQGMEGSAIIDAEGKVCGIYDSFFFFIDQALF